MKNCLVFGDGSTAVLTPYTKVIASVKGAKYLLQNGYWLSPVIDPWEVDLTIDDWFKMCMNGGVIEDHDYVADTIVFDKNGIYVFVKEIHEYR